MFHDLISINISYVFTALIRLLFACILGGIVGFEREYTNHKPAGFRTHIMVSVGAALVMVTSEFVFDRFSASTQMDPARLGAQVISGIGFLGAGAIIRHGANVKGLTTAASLWAVACIGLACGIGFHSGAIIATLLFYVVLLTLKGLEQKIKLNSRNCTLKMQIDSSRISMDRIYDHITEKDIIVYNIQITKNEGDTRNLCLHLSRIKQKKLASLMEQLSDIEGILSVEG